MHPLNITCFAPSTKYKNISCSLIVIRFSSSVSFSQFFDLLCTHGLVHSELNEENCCRPHRLKKYYMLFFTVIKLANVYNALKSLNCTTCFLANCCIRLSAIFSKPKNSKVLLELCLYCWHHKASSIFTIFERLVIHVAGLYSIRGHSVPSSPCLVM